MAKARNVFACLVHENRDCIADLVENLRYLDPGSTILLYNGSGSPDLLIGFSPPAQNVVVHPSPQPMKWGYLHGFAIDSLRWALAHVTFDTLTIVDSDQLGVRPGYSEYLGAFLASRPRTGLLGSCSASPGARAKAAPALDALKERELWRPFVRRFRHGEYKFVQWTFWPATVFTASAARDLVALWDGDDMLRDLMARSKIWATEEVVLPTLVTLLGHEVVKSPCSYDYVKYNVSFSLSQLDRALVHPHVYWMHPVPRQYDHPIRRRIRQRCGDYLTRRAVRVADRPLLRAGRVITEISAINGWLSDEEADLLMAGAARALEHVRSAPTVVEVGSYCGKATVALGRVAEAVRPEARIYAIDPHGGTPPAQDQGSGRCSTSLEMLRQNLAGARLEDRVEVIVRRSTAIGWTRPIAFLLIDGRHDYASVAADFTHFDCHLADDAVVAFHDYADYYPGVKQFVDELLVRGDYERLERAGSLILLVKRRSASAQDCEAKSSIVPQAVRSATAFEDASPQPLVSCIMPTADRPTFVPHAIRQFLMQDYPNRELIIVDDGKAEISSLVPRDPRIRYVRLQSRCSVGAKRNLACRQARGEVIVHWDDDDWSAPWRVSYQVTELLRSGAALCGLSRVLYHQPSTGSSWQFVYPAGPRCWVSGNTFCYLKRSWQAASFLDINNGEDAYFIRNPSHRPIEILGKNDFFVAMVHARNVGLKRTAGRYWHPLATEVVRGLMGDDFERYGAPPP